MFKNISSRIILTFSSIVLAGLLLFALITFGIFTKFSVRTDETIMSLSAKSVAETVLGYTMLAEDAGNSNPTAETIVCQLYPKQFKQSMEKYAEDEIGVHIYDTEGALLVAVNQSHEAEPIEPLIKEETDNRLSRGDTSGFLGTFTFHGSDEKESTLYILPIVNDEKDNSLMGYVVVSSLSDSINSAKHQLLSAIITTCVWLLLGTAFSIIVVGKRITKPFSQINKKLKEYSDGNTEVRLPVTSDDEISVLSKSINDMMDTIERNDMGKDTFLASVAHDLRTPITTISGFADGILDGTIPPEKEHQYLATISEESKRLSRLISTLLTTTKMQNQKINPKVFNVTEKALSTLFTFEGQIYDKDLRVEIPNDDAVMVNADPDAIHQVFYNLIHNAVKFSPTGGSLVIDIEEDTKNGKAVISVQNDGEGIPEEEVPHVFEKFYKTDRSRGLDKSGMGLGLFIVKTVIDNHKEKITIRSGRNKGCEFSFTLPLANRGETAER